MNVQMIYDCLEAVQNNANIYIDVTFSIEVMETFKIVIIHSAGRTLDDVSGRRFFDCIITPDCGRLIFF